jgi:hypothetical protein
MPEIQRLLIQEGDENYEVYVEAARQQTCQNLGVSASALGKRWCQRLRRFGEARKVIRGQALLYWCFQNFAAAEIEEVTIKFGLKFSGTGGIPFIAQVQPTVGD